MFDLDASVGSAIYASDAMFDGTILSFQPAHPEDGFSGVPTNGQVIRNVAWRNFCRLTGRSASLRSEGDGTFVITDPGASKLSQARTNKGGHEILPSQASAGATTGAFYYAPDAVKQYVLDNTVVGSSTAHVFALVVYMVPVRDVPAGFGAPTSMAIAAVQRPGANSMLRISPSASEAPPGAALPATAYARPSVFPIGVPTLRMMTGDRWVSTKPTLGQFHILAGAGNSPDVTNPFFQNKSGGVIIYRVDLVDLTVSGLDLNLSGERGPAAAAYPDYERFRLAHRRHLDFMFGPRGAFYGDNIPVPASAFP